MKPRQPPKVVRPEDRCQFQQAKSLGDVSGSPVPDLCSQQAEVFFVVRRNRKEFHRWHPARSVARSAARRTRSRRTTSASTASARSRSPTTTRVSTPAAAKRKIQAGPPDIWRYADFLPLAERPRDPLQPGLTPLVRADRLAERLGLGEVWIKNDAANPTHSFKDRVVAVALAKARELGFETVACASTGNLANAVAAHAAAAGLESYVFVPADLEEQKLLATGVYGTQPGRRARQLRRRQPALHRALPTSARGRS